MPPGFYGLCRHRTAKSGRKTAAFPRELTGLPRRGTLRPERGIRGADGMADSQNSVGEVRVKPDRLHAFAVAICRADGSSDEEARLVADHLVLANLFGHDSHGVGMMPAYIQNTTTGRCGRNHRAKILRDNGAGIGIDGGRSEERRVGKECRGGWVQVRGESQMR